MRFTLISPGHPYWELTWLCYTRNNRKYVIKHYTDYTTSHGSKSSVGIYFHRIIFRLSALFFKVRMQNEDINKTKGIHAINISAMYVLVVKSSGNKSFKQVNKNKV